MTTRHFLLVFSFALLSHAGLGQVHQPSPDSIRWLREMTAEVATVSAPQESIRQWMSQLGVICHKGNKDYASQRPQAVVLCRSIVRLGLREHAGFATPEYLQILKQLSSHFHESNDTLMALALELEYNRLSYDQCLTYDKIGEIDSEETIRLFDLYGHQYLEPRIRLLWLANYLFGRNGLATRMESEIGIGYMRNENRFTTGYSYWRRASMKKGYAQLNDANTNLALLTLRENVVSPLMERLREHDPEYAQQLQYRDLLYHNDPSTVAQQARREILPMVEKSRQGDIESALLYREVGIDHLSQSDLNYAIHYFQKSIDCYQQYAVNGNDTLFWGNTLYLLGTAQERCGHPKEAKKAFETAAKLLENSPAIEYSRYFALVAMARVSILQGERFSTRKAMKEIEAMLEGPDDTDIHFDFLPDIGAEYRNKDQAIAMLHISYMHLRSLELEKSDITEAINYAYFAQQMLEEKGMADNYFYFQNRLLLARLLTSDQGKELVRANPSLNPKTLLQTCAEAYREGKTIELPDVATAYNLLAEMAVREGKETEAASLFRQAYQTLTDYALKHLFTMTEGNRAKFWEKVKPAITATLTACIDHSEAMPSLAAVALDCSLFMKGLLLQSSNELRHIVYESGDRALINQYEQMLQRQEAEPLSEHLAMLPEELELMHHPTVAAGLAEAKRSFLFNCEQLKNTMKKGEIAVELLETDQQFDDRSILTTDQQYGAIVVKKGMAARYIPLVREKELGKVTRLDDPCLYTMVWQSLEDMLKDCRSVYFSATGLFHNLPIENAIDHDGRSINERFSTHRLSSLRQVAANQTISKEKAALFGGLTYRLDQTAWLSRRHQESSPLVFRDLPDIESLRDDRIGVKELPGTLEETNFIEGLLRKRGIPTSLNQRVQGTEEKFKQLSGQDITLLHIGTHGYFNSAEASTTDENVLLSRCGLLFAGAGNTLHSEGLPETTADDGIVTAREISSMDLRRLDMAVLSACKTGLGKIGSDGVFGLQRGFKKAGAKTLVMSLRNVDDQITATFIRYFYTLLLQDKKSKHEAFVEAQRRLRRELPADSDEWTTFIMVDDI